MEKKAYIRPVVSESRLETMNMMATFGLNRYDDPADPSLDVLVNEGHFTDIWGN